MPSSVRDRIETTAAGLCLAVAAAVFCLPIANPDLWWHLSAARFIVEHGAFPREEWLSHTLNGVPWADFEWGVQLLWYGLHRVGGLAGLWALKSTLFFATAGVLWRTFGLYGAGFAARSLGVSAWALATTLGNDVRPENFSLLFFAALWFLLERRRLASGGERWWIAGSAIGFAVWANMHAGFVYGLALLSLYAFADFVRRRDRTLFAAAAAGAAAALVNPYGAAVYLVAIRHAAEGDVLQAFIREWGEATLLAPSLIPFWAILAASYASLLRGQFKRLNAPIEHIAALLLLSLSAAAHIRTGVYFATVALPVLGAALSRRPVPRFLMPLGAVLGVCFFLVVLSPAFKERRVFRSHYVPARAAAFLEAQKKTLAGKPLFNPWHWGGYLGFRLYPDYRVFVDGRYPFHSMLPGMNEARQSPERYQAYLAGHGVEIALVQRVGQYMRVPIVRRDGSREMLMRPFYLFFLPRERWGLVHWDPRALVFVRRDAAPEAWMRKHEFRYFRPDDLSAAAMSVRDGIVSFPEVEAEVERYRAGEIPEDERAQTERWLRFLREGPS